jgi:hypothetical protein
MPLYPTTGPGETGKAVPGSASMLGASRCKINCPDPSRALTVEVTAEARIREITMNDETVLSQTILEPRADLPTASAATMMCDVCELVGGPFAPGEAAYLRAVHNRLHHGIMSAAA